MSAYDLVLFVHVAGAAGLFLTVGTWMFGIAALSRASRVEEVRTLTELVFLSDRALRIAGALLVPAGAYMWLTTWGPSAAWVAVSIPSVVAAGILGGLVIEPRLKAAARLATSSPDGPLPAQLRQALEDRALTAGVRIEVGLMFGIVFLMITKPDVALGVVAVALFSVLGLASATPLRRAAPSHG